MTPYEESIRPRWAIRLFGSDRLRYVVDEDGVTVQYGDVDRDPTSSLTVPAGAVRGGSVVWDRESGYDPRENPRRTLALVRWLYFWMPYADPIEALVEVRTDDGPELFGTADPEGFLAAVGTVMGTDPASSGSSPDDDVAGENDATQDPSGGDGTPDPSGGDATSEPSDGDVAPETGDADTPSEPPGGG